MIKVSFPYRPAQRSDSPKKADNQGGHDPSELSKQKLINDMINKFTN